MDKFEKFMKILKTSLSNEESPIYKFEKMIQSQKVLGDLIQNETTDSIEKIDKILEHKFQKLMIDLRESLSNRIFKHVLKIGILVICSLAVLTQIVTLI